MKIEKESDHKNGNITKLPWKCSQWKKEWNLQLPNLFWGIHYQQASALVISKFPREIDLWVCKGGPLFNPTVFPALEYMTMLPIIIILVYPPLWDKAIVKTCQNPVKLSKSAMIPTELLFQFWAVALARTLGRVPPMAEHGSVHRGLSWCSRTRGDQFWTFNRGFCLGENDHELCCHNQNIISIQNNGCHKQKTVVHYECCHNVYSKHHAQLPYMLNYVAIMHLG